LSLQGRGWANDTVPLLAAEASESIAPRRTRTIYATTSSVKMKSV
jgi:hypothetical protein